jgi:hypothetical protein
MRYSKLAISITFTCIINCSIQLAKSIMSNQYSLNNSIFMLLYLVVILISSYIFFSSLIEIFKRILNEKTNKNAESEK